MKNHTNNGETITSHTNVGSNVYLELHLPIRTNSQLCDERNDTIQTQIEKKTLFSKKTDRLFACHKRSKMASVGQKITTKIFRKYWTLNGLKALTGFSRGNGQLKSRLRKTCSIFVRVISCTLIINSRKCTRRSLLTATAMKAKHQNSRKIPNFILYNIAKQMVPVPFSLLPKRFHLNGYTKEFRQQIHKLELHYMSEIATEIFV